MATSMAPRYLGTLYLGTRYLGKGRIWRTSSAALVAALLVAGCVATPGYQAPNFPFGARFAGAPKAQALPVLLENTEWWRRLNDPVLDRLITVALQDNLTLAIARERVVEAQTERGRVPGAGLLSPQVSATASGTNGGALSSDAQARLGLDWAIDPYGSKQGSVNAATGRAEAAADDADAAQLVVLQNVTNSYLDLRLRQRLVALSKRELSSRNQTLALARKLSDSGEGTALDITRSQARVAEIQAQLPGQEAAVAARQAEIAVLAGVAPGQLPPDLTAGLLRTQDQPRPQMTPDVGIPADLLRNRPDIRAAERRYYAAVAEVGVASASLYPRLSLSGAISLNAASRDTSYYFGPVLQFPSLPGGTARAGVAARHSQARQAHAAWKATVLNALVEVETALIDYRAVSSAQTASARAARLYREALEMTRDVVGNGEATLSDLTAAETAVAGSDAALAETIFRQASSFAALNIRLGSGHAVKPQAAAPVAPTAPKP